MAEEIINGGVEVEENATETTTQAEKVETFTKEEVMKLIQQESDKRVTQALQTAQKKHEKELERATMSAEEKKNAEKDELIAELQAQVKANAIERNRSELKTILSQKGMPVIFADMFEVGEDIENTKKLIDELEKIRKSDITAEVERRMISTTPKASESNDLGMTKDEFNALPIYKQQELILKNPEYKKFLS